MLMYLLKGFTRIKLKLNQRKLMDDCPSSIFTIYSFNNDIVWKECCKLTETL